MGRRTLENRIRILDEQLAVELALLKLDGRERYQALQRVSPLYWAGAGVAAGLLVGKLLGANGPRLLISQGGQLFRLASLMLPVAAAGGSAADS